MRLFVTRLAHVGVDGGTERSKSRTAASHGRRTRVLGQDTASQASRSDAVGKIVLGSQALDTAFDSGEQSADLAEVLGHRERARSHILEADLELLAERQRCNGGLTVGAAHHRATVGSIVRHLLRS